MHELKLIIKSIEEAGIDITWIVWDGESFDIDTSDPEKTSEILKNYGIRLTT
jgi:hypothetical protein